PHGTARRRPRRLTPPPSHRSPAATHRRLPLAGRARLGRPAPRAIAAGPLLGRRVPLSFIIPARRSRPRPLGPAVRTFLGCFFFRLFPDGPRSGSHPDMRGARPVTVVATGTFSTASVVAAP